ncbi:putative Ig domain-containing protein [Hydrogenophaga sp. BPS33]|uniref:putative Ig domain-containing protein n=1 Tax=Hydrogenophaga sp. BPS33 TaxID=2651974 RepID=UPI001357D8AB|nr:putative Ig domain-containing protein [Hydrogenophaga sp. BPS33]
MGEYLPDGFWHRLESVTFGEGAARLDPTGSVYTSMLLHRIDNSIALPDLGRLFDVAGSAREGRETVALLNALAQVFNPSATPLANNADDKAIVAFAGRIAAVTDRVPGGIQISATTPSASEARNDFGAMLSLQLGLPFAIRLPGASSTTSAAAMELYALHRTDYERWLTDHNAIASGADASTLHFSDDYLQARSEYVRALASTHTEEIALLGGVASVRALGAASNTRFEDRAHQQQLQVLGNTPLLPASKVVFGGNTSDADLLGGDKDDRLFGGQGDDALSGEGGADHLEGNIGIDTLIGGLGDDTLLGGQGNDTYVFQSGHGQDVVLDADGLGRIEIDGQTLSVGKQLAQNSNAWEDSSAKFRIVRLDETTLHISAKNNSQDSITVKGWRDGDLGLTLGDDVDDGKSPEFSALYKGDQRGLKLGVEARQDDVLPDDASYGHYDWSSTTWLADGTLQGGKAEGGFADVISAAGRSDNVRMLGLGGNDALTGGKGEDRIEGGDGDDLISGGAGADHILGGAGSDFIYSGQTIHVRQRVKDDDQYDRYPAESLIVRGPTWAAVNTVGGYTLDSGRNNSTTNSGAGEARGDFVDAGDGNDQVVGSDGADTLLGGQGKDVLWGAGGDDHLLGGTEDDYLLGDGLEDGAGRLLQHTDPSRHGNDILEGEAGDDTVIGGGGADHLLGGDGDDELYGDSDAKRPLHGSHHGQDVLSGGQGDDLLVGGGADDSLSGGVGDDLLFGDDISSQQGAYAIDTAFHGVDHLQGGDGNDGLWGGGKGDTLHGGKGDDELQGDGDALDGKAHGDDQLFGEEGNDRLQGDGGDDTLVGGQGNDRLVGDSETLGAQYHGDDRLFGGQGDDVLFGNGGNDLLDAGDGHNQVFGDEGDDTYIVRTSDVTNAEGATQSNRTFIADLEGRNTLRVDAARSALDVALQGQSVVLRWRGALPGTWASVEFETPATAATFTIETADGQALSLARLLGDRLQVATVQSAYRDDAALAGAAHNDRLFVYGSRNTVTAGKGDDEIVLNGTGSTLRFDRGDGHDVVRGYGSGGVLELGAGITLADVRAELNAMGRLVLVVRGEAGQPDDAIALDMSSDSASSCITTLRFANGVDANLETLLRQQGVDVKAAALALGVQGTRYADRFAHMQDGATLQGGEGDDVYVYATGSVETPTTSTIRDSQGRNRLQLNGVTDWASVSVTRGGAASPNDLIVSVGSLSIRVTDALVLADRFDVSIGGPDAPGSTRSLASFVAEMPGLQITGTHQGDHIVTSDQASSALGGQGDDVLLGGAQNDLLSGGDGNDTLGGHAGSDLLLGGAGDDVYLVDFSLGHDEIIDPQGRNTVRFAAHIRPQDVSLERIGTSADVRFVVGPDRSVTVRRALEGAVASYAFADGTVWMPQDFIDQMVSPDGSILGGDDTDNAFSGTSGGDFISGYAGDDVLRGQAGDDEILGGNGHDTLVGGRGNDRLDGGPGDDVFEFQLGDGVDRIAGLEGADRVRFGAGIRPSAVVGTRVQVDGVAYVQLSYSRDDAVLIPADAPVAQLVFEFAGGERRHAASWFADIVRGHTAPIEGTAGHDKLFGYAGADVMRGGAGADTLSGGAGDDTLVGDAGADLLLGGAGVDSYRFEAGQGLERIQDDGDQPSRLVLGNGVALQDLRYARVGIDLMVQHETSGAAAYIRGVFATDAQWTLVDAQGSEHNLGVVAQAAVATQTLEQRKAAFVQALDVKAGPQKIDAFVFSDTGSASKDVGTLEEKVFVFNKATRRIESGGGEPVTVHPDPTETKADRTYLYIVRGTRTYEKTEVTYHAALEKFGGRIYDVTELLSNYGGVVQLEEGARVFTQDDRIFVEEPVRSNIYWTEVYTRRTVTENYADHYYRNTTTVTRLHYDFTGSDGADTLNLGYGSGSVTASLGAGDDVLIGDPYGAQRDDLNLLNASGQPGWPDGSLGRHDWIDAGAGNDRIISGDGDDELHGGMGHDYLDAGAGSDVYGVDAQDDGWDVLVDSGMTTVEVRLHWTHPNVRIPALEAEFLALMAPGSVSPSPDFTNPSWVQKPADLPALQLGPGSPAWKMDYAAAIGRRNWEMPAFDPLLDFGWLTGSMPLTAPNVNALMALAQKIPAHRVLGGDGNHSLNIVSEELSALIAKATGASSTWLEAGGLDPAALAGVQMHGAQLVSPVVDTVRFGAGIDAGALHFDWSVVDTDAGKKQALSFSWGGLGGVHVVLPDANDPLAPGVGIERFEFADGTVWPLSLVLELAPPRPSFSSAVVAGEPMGVVELREDEAWSFQMPELAFEFGGDRQPRYAVNRANGSGDLPAWLRFDPATGVLSGTPANGDVGPLELRITASLTSTQSASQTVTLRVLNTNDAPVISSAVGDVTVQEGETLDWTLAPHHVHDDDPQDRYSYSVQAADAPDLPDWLRFDPVTGRLKGQPGPGDAGTVALRLVVQDISGAASERLFKLNVQPLPTPVHEAAPPAARFDAPAAAATPAATLTAASSDPTWDLSEPWSPKSALWRHISDTVGLSSDGARRMQAQRERDAEQWLSHAPLAAATGPKSEMQTLIDGQVEQMRRAMAEFSAPAPGDISHTPPHEQRGSIQPPVIAASW